MKNNFTVLILGRENVGKSSIFNKIIKQQKAIVDDLPGVTRDRLYGEVAWDRKNFTVVDTGGILFDDKNVIKSLIIKDIEKIFKDVDLVMLVVDAQAGILPDDKRIFEFVKKNTDNYMLVVNKADNERLVNESYEFYNLGVDKIFPISAAHSYAIDDVLDYIAAQVPEEKPDEKSADDIVKLAIVGKENVGKSMLFNTIINEERAIVTDIPGTTRDSIDSMIEINGSFFLIIDTAGVKRRKNIREKVEGFSMGRTFVNIKRADMVVHVIDAIEGIQEIDKKIIGYAFENFKAMIIAVNKWDLVAEKDRDRIKKEYIEYVKFNFKFIDFVPIVFISAREKMGLDKLIDIVIYVENQYNFRVKTSILNKVFQEAVYQNAPSDKRGSLKVYYMTQASVKPPTFVVFVNQKKKLHFSYLRYLENQLRAHFGFEGVPLKIKIREKGKKAT